LKSITVTEDKILAQFTFKNGGNSSIMLKSEQDIETILDGIKHNKINLTNLKNNKILTNIDGIDFVGSDIAPKIGKDGIVEHIKNAELIKTGDYFSLCIYSDKLGLTKVDLTKGDIIPITKFLEYLRQRYYKLGNFIGLSEDGNSYYYDSGPIINVRTEEDVDKLYIKNITDSSIVAINSLGLLVEIPFTSLVNPIKISEIFNKDVLIKLEGSPRFVKSFGSLNVVGGRFLMNSRIASEISNFSGTEDVELEGIDFNTNTITLGGKSYNLNSSISEKVLDT
jgi:hypothetical protein